MTTTELCYNAVHCGEEDLCRGDLKQYCDACDELICKYHWELGTIGVATCVMLYLRLYSRG
jgi:hypothetical protein